MTAGYIGGWVDDFLSMVMNVFLILPQLPLLIIISSYLHIGGNNPAPVAAEMAIVITLTGWAWERASCAHKPFLCATVTS